MNRLAVWTLACRPRTLVASFSPAFIAAALSLRAGVFNIPLFLFTLLTGIFIQIASNLTNDYCDYIKGADTNQRKGFLRVTQAGLISTSSMKRAILGVCILSLITGSYLIAHAGMGIALILCVYLLLSVLYTAGPFPLGYLGLGDLLVLLFYGPGAVLITYFLQTHTLSWDAFFAGLSLGSLSTGILVLNNIRDVEEDRNANKKTLIVRNGVEWGKKEFVFLILLAFLSLTPLFCSSVFSSLVLLCLPQALWIARSVWNHADSLQLNTLFVSMGKLIWAFTFLLTIGILL